MAKKKTSLRDRILRNIKKDTGPKGDCWEWKGCCTAPGYGKIRHGSKTVRVHRAMYEIFIAEIEEGMIIRHTCDNPPCCNPNHLKQGTHQDNVRDRDARGRTASGEKHGQSKLSKEKVEDIKWLLFVKKQTDIEIGKRFGVSRRSIYDIRNAITWAHVRLVRTKKPKQMSIFSLPGVE